MASNNAIKEVLKTSILSRYTGYLTLPFAFGCTITGLNIWNYKLSPCYINFKEKEKTLFFLKLGAFCTIKGMIYGSFFPISAIGIGLESLNTHENNFNNHFVPYSKYSKIF